MPGSGFDRFISPVDVQLVGPGQAGDRHRLAVFAPFGQGANFFGNPADRFKIAG